MTGQNPPSSRIGVLLVNLGTPEAPTAQALRPYLRQFLGDHRVIEYPRWLWRLILNGIILNVRPRRSAKLYAKIWTDEGSPLMVISQKLADKLQAALGKNIKVVLAMRYRPSLHRQRISPTTPSKCQSHHHIATLPTIFGHNDRHDI